MRSDLFEYETLIKNYNAYTENFTDMVTSKV